MEGSTAWRKAMLKEVNWVKVLKHFIGLRFELPWRV
jgi:hypothetical protein